MSKKNAGSGDKRSLGTVPPLSTLILPEQLEQSSSLDRVVSEAQAAEILGYSKDTLRREFQAGRGPPRVRLSARRIGYRLSVLYAHLAARTEQPGASA
jgi:predicted DNA-binding transcriptional regulator AlpA